jgi:hypothetical protein
LGVFDLILLTELDGAPHFNIMKRKTSPLVSPWSSIKDPKLRKSALKLIAGVQMVPDVTTFRPGLSFALPSREGVLVVTNGLTGEDAPGCPTCFVANKGQDRFVQSCATHKQTVTEETAPARECLPPVIMSLVFEYASPWKEHFDKVMVQLGRHRETLTRKRICEETHSREICDYCDAWQCDQEDLNPWNHHQGLQKFAICDECYNLVCVNCYRDDSTVDSCPTCDDLHSCSCDSKLIFENPRPGHCWRDKIVEIVRCDMCGATECKDCRKEHSSDCPDCEQLSIVL